MGSDRRAPGIDPIIGVDRLHTLLDSDRPPRLLDVRWALDGSTGRGTYREGHLPGAVYVDLPTELAGAASQAAGRHPLPDPRHFARTMREAGVGDGDTVVVYDDTDGSPAARLVWMLRAVGVEAALLDGGLSAWDGEISREDPTPEPAEFTARPWRTSAIADIDEVASGRFRVIDARAAERYRGESEPVDPRAGHVPGALNAPFSGNLDDSGRFLRPKKLRRRFQDLGVDRDEDVVVYCGSGVTATHDVLALWRAGYPSVRLFPGSWSQWSADPSRPLATGPEPGAAA